MTVLIVTGTGTGVGKTIASAALASHARQAGIDVAVCKPVQTGTGSGADAGDDDLAEIGRLAGVTELAGLARYPLPMAPVAAAEQAGTRLPTRQDMTRFIRNVDRPDRLTLVEGAGGLLVELAESNVTLRDLAVDLGAATIVVTTPELGTLNVTALTLEALAAQRVSCVGLVIGSWPPGPGLVETSNRSALAQLAPVRAVLPAGAGAMDTSEFAIMSAQAFDFDWLTTLVH
ncbi:dethiobiotin synthase [Mycobacterium sp.]|uniref:dethiobiotin synthase n=1 Tax=Mycobacterium sp. TaxID=1785 RepID=UPI003BACC907